MQNAKRATCIPPPCSMLGARPGHHVRARQHRDSKGGVAPARRSSSSPNVAAKTRGSSSGEGGARGGRGAEHDRQFFGFAQLCSEFSLSKANLLERKLSRNQTFCISAQKRRLEATPCNWFSLLIFLYLPIWSLTSSFYFFTTAIHFIFKIINIK